MGGPAARTSAQVRVTARHAATVEGECVSSVVDPGLLSLIGKTAAPQTQLVTRRDIRKYAVATGQRQRKYLDGDEAPPMFHVALFWPVLPLEELSANGVAIDAMFPDIPGRRPMAGGLKIDFRRPLKPGDELTATRALTNIFAKQGSNGSLIFVEVTMTVIDAAGELVLTEKTTRIMK
jgi:hydroxyacyl-ACP dehydratase HTD2-like protein with hotdog domain